jgi:hypothetical protein
VSSHVHTTSSRSPPIIIARGKGWEGLRTVMSPERSIKPGEWTWTEFCLPGWAGGLIKNLVRADGSFRLFG